MRCPCLHKCVSLIGEDNKHVVLKEVVSRLEFGVWEAPSSAGGRVGQGEKWGTEGSVL